MEDNRISEEIEEPVNNQAEQIEEPADEKIEQAEESADEQGEQAEELVDEQPDQDPKEAYIYSPNIENEYYAFQEPEKDDRKKSIAMLVLSIICGILAVAVIALSVSLFFLQENQNPGTGDGNPQAPTTGDESEPPQVSGGSASVADIAEAGCEYTVAIQILREYEDGTVALGTGTGIILTENGYIATNSHVVSDADRINVYTYDGKTYSGNIVADDPSHDVALIRINPSDSDEPFKTAHVGQYKNVRVGDQVVAIGTPHSIDYAWTVSVGHVSNMGRDIVVESGTKVTMIQIDVPVNPGNSGGPLINEKGEVIGIVAAKLDSKYEGINFAIPISEYMNFFNAAIEADMSKPQLGVLGVSVQGGNYYYLEDSTSTRVVYEDGRYYWEVSDYYGTKREYLTDEETKNVVYAPKSGFLITEITKKSDANGKLKPYDIITGFDGTELVCDDTHDPHDTVVNILKTKKANDVVVVEYLRDGIAAEVRITLINKN